MKPFLGIDITGDSENAVLNEKELTAAKTPANIIEKYNESVDRIQKAIDGAEMPLVVRILKYLCVVVTILAVGLCLLVFRAGGEIFSETWNTAPWLFFVVGAGVLGLAVIVFFERRMAKELTDEKRFSADIKVMNDTAREALAFLRVPEDAVNADVILFRYKITDGEVVPKAVKLAPTPYIACDMKVFAEEGKLCLASIDARYEIPLSSVRKISRVDKKITVMGWNKKDAPDSEKYSIYSLKADQYGCVSAKCSYVLEFTLDSTEWGLYFPCYELAVFEKLTGKKCA